MTTKTPDEIKIGEELNKMVDRRILIKRRNGYVYPNWLIPYCKDDVLMGGILNIFDKAFSLGVEEGKRQTQLGKDSLVKIGYNKACEDIIRLFLEETSILCTPKYAIDKIRKLLEGQQ